MILIKKPLIIRVISVVVVIIFLQSGFVYADGGLLRVPSSSQRQRFQDKFKKLYLNGVTENDIFETSWDTGERPVDITFSKEAWAWLSESDKKKLKRVLIAPFSDLKEGIDYYIKSGERSVIIKLDEPIELPNKKVIRALKVKGVQFDHGMLQNAHDGPKIIPKHIKVNKEGLWSAEEVKEFDPEGGAPLEAIKAEFIRMLIIYRGDGPTLFPIAMAEFLSEEDKFQGKPMGALVLGLKDPEGLRIAHCMRKLAIDVIEKNMATSSGWKEFNSLLERHGRNIREMHNWIADYNPHHGNVSEFEGIFTAHDLERGYWVDELTDEQRLGYKMIDILYTLSQLHYELFEGTLDGLYYTFFLTVASEVIFETEKPPDLNRDCTYDPLRSFLKGYFHDQSFTDITDRKIHEWLQYDSDINEKEEPVIVKYPLKKWLIDCEKKML